MNSDPAEKEFKKVILCSICEYVLLNKIGICQECKEFLKISEITDSLYLTNYDTSKNYKLLSDLGVKQILVVGHDMLHDTEDFKTKYILIDDCPSEKISKHFETAHEFIDQGVTVVHCYAGMSRSPSIVISYLMKKYKMTLEEALSHCKSRRPIVNPNIGFIKQLKNYEENLFKTRE